MMTLTTVAEKIDDESARVFWRTGTTNKGVLDVTLDFESPDAALICELVAIRHLLFEKQVFDREPGSGAGYKLKVSKGAIRKLAQGKSAKQSAVKFAAFLSGRLQGVAIAVSQSMEFMADPEEGKVETLLGSREEFAQTFEKIHTPSMGDLLVTQHALDQYQARITSGDPKRPWMSLVKRLQHPELKIRKLTDKVLDHKARKYGRSDNVEAWGHPSSSFTFLVVKNEAGERVLVTVFERKEWA